MHLSFSGGYIGGVTPVPISNTEVKPSRADGTPRETARESRSLPDLLAPHQETGAGSSFFGLRPVFGTCPIAAGEPCAPAPVVGVPERFRTLGSAGVPLSD